MAGLDPAIPTSAAVATDGRVKPGHDGTTPVPSLPIFMVGAEGAEVPRNLGVLCASAVKPPCFGSGAYADLGP